MNKKVILTDVDGVLLNYDHAFDMWMTQHGYEQIEFGNRHYRLADRYSVTDEQVSNLVGQFNESAAMGFLPALRDAVYYVKRLHEEHQYEFHCITSMGSEPNAVKLRQMNLNKLFGDTVVTRLVCLDHTDPKKRFLEEYRDSGLYWIEDNFSNLMAGRHCGLKPVLMEHGFNMQRKLKPDVAKVTNWREIYELVTGEAA